MTTQTIERQLIDAAAEINDKLGVPVPLPMQQVRRRRAAAHAGRIGAAGFASVLAVGGLVVATDLSSSGSIDAPAASDSPTTLDTEPVLPTAAARDDVAATSVPPGDEDPGTPVAVTGQRIGEVPSPGPPPWLVDGEIDPAMLPAWGTVAKDGFVVGYIKPVEVLLGDGDTVTIFGEQGQPIGAFVDGIPVIDSEGGDK